jgi:hypothetical protein
MQLGWEVRSKHQNQKPEKSNPKKEERMEKATSSARREAYIILSPHQCRGCIVTYLLARVRICAIHSSSG